MSVLTINPKYDIGLKGHWKELSFV